jgi:hypothetical protein
VGYAFWGPDDLISGAFFLVGARWLATSWFEPQQGSSAVSPFRRPLVAPSDAMWTGLIIAVAVALNDLHYNMTTGLLLSRSGPANPALVQGPVLIGLCAAFAFTRPLGWVLAPATVALAYAFNDTFGAPFDSRLSGRPAIIFQTVSTAPLEAAATVLTTLVFCWAARRIGRAGWHPGEERMERDGSLAPLFGALWQDSLRALGLALFTWAAGTAFVWWLEQWPLDIVAPSGK